MKIPIFLSIILILFLSAGCASQPQAVINGNAVVLEIADTPDERMTGLMHREELAEDRGMLFVFDEDKMQGFWMKNTLISLDIIFIGEDMTITRIFEAELCGQDPCATYNARGKYVLEVNRGYSKAHNISVGDKVVLKGIK